MAGFAKGLLVGILCICLGGLGWLLIAQPHFTAAEAQDLKNQFTREVPGEDLSGNISLEGEMLDWESLQVQYPDVKGWLTIPGTCVDYPVLQSSPQDPEHYLRRNYDHKWRMAGSLFFQYDCSLDNLNLVIFGHNMTDGSMFAILKKMADPVYLQNHSTVLLQTAEGVTEYRILKAMTTDTNRLDFNRTQFAGTEDFVAFAGSMGIQAGPEDRLLTLVTCSYDWEEARTVVVARKEK